MAHHDDFATEPLPGLPERPPAGEEVLWQGRPDAWALAREAFGLRWIMGYFALVVLWRASDGWLAAGPAGALALALPYVALAGLAALVILWMARAQARATVYTITTNRVVLRVGAALSVTYNLPFSRLEGAALDMRGNGIGTIALALPDGERLPYLSLWPHVRPWHLRAPQPALRCIPDAEQVSARLAAAAASRLHRPVIERRSPIRTNTAAVAAE
jgi:hypothetical protein